MSNTTTQEQEQQVSLPPLGFEVIKREFIKDKGALFALFLLVAILSFILFSPFFVDFNALTKVTPMSIFNKYAPPGTEGYFLGADDGGRDILALLVIGARNSLFIGWSVTIITAIVGITVGIMSGYYGGIFDDIMMRIVDFIRILPQLVIIIVLTTIIRKYDHWTLIWVISAFGWTYNARLFRTATLSEASKDYVSASKTMGTYDWKIMLLGVLPNLSSLLVTNLILAFAGNIALETGLSFLGFGLPTGTPSLGTLISAASSPDVIKNKIWVWLPATLLVLIMTLCISYIGQALKRAANAKQRLG